MKTSFIGLILIALASMNVVGQERCLSQDESKNVIARLGAPVAKNDNWRREMLKMRETREKLETRLFEKPEERQKILTERDQLGKTHLLRLCEAIKEYGFPTKDAVKADGFEAAFYIINNSRAFDLQSEILPTLAEAANKGIVPKYYLAPLVDNIRIGRGMSQIFGTQAKIRDGIVYLYPLYDEANLAEWRKSYNLPPLADFIRELENRFLMPVLKTSRPAALASAKEKAEAKKEAAILGLKDEEEVLQVNTKLVSLNLHILNRDLASADNSSLKADDFIVYENGKEQKISFFSNAEQPFDLILLLDFSGSTAGKQGLIRKAAARFVETARPTDRIAVVAFTDEIRLVSDLTADRQTLLEKIKKLEMKGGSRIWDALAYVYQHIIEKRSEKRRSAVVFMTDAMDGSLNTTYTDMVETVRQGETTIFPVFLKTGDYYHPKVGEMGQKSMAILAEESGGEMYPARKFEDLVGIYERIVKDLSRVYTISYEPTDETRDGSWRDLQVKIKSHPNLFVRTRQGYYAN